MKRINPALYLLIATIIVACENKKENKVTAKKEVSKPKVEVAKDTTHLQGVWFDESIKTDKGEQIAYEIVSRGSKVYIQVITFTGKKLNVPDSPDLSPDATELKKTGNKYVSVQSAGESYIIDHNSGDLFIYDQSGLIAHCKRLL